MDWFRGKSTLEATDFTMIMDFSGVIFSFNQSIDTISFEDHDLRLGDSALHMMQDPVRITVVPHSQ